MATIYPDISKSIIYPQIYNLAMKGLIGLNLPSVPDRLYMILLYGYTFSYSHAAYSDVSPNELPDGNGYFEGGVDMLGADVTYDAATKKIKIVHTGTPPQWFPFSGTCSSAIVGVYNGDQNPPMLYMPFQEAITGDGGVLRIGTSTRGLIEF